MATATKAIITLTGRDMGNWAGQYGSRMTNVSLV
jgi:hypothetical protein